MEEETPSDSGLPRSLYRAGELLRDMWYTYRENVFDLDIDYIETDSDEPGTLRIHLAPRGIKTRPIDWVERFPEDKVLENQKTAILTSSSCSESLVYMMDVVQYVLRYLDPTIEELEVEPENVALNVVLLEHEEIPTTQTGASGSENVGVTHEVFLIHPKKETDLESFVIDLTGAQYSWEEIILTQSDFYAFKLKPLVGAPKPAGSRRQRLLQLADEEAVFGQGVDIDGIYLVHEEASPHLLDVLQACEKDNNVGEPIQEILEGDEKDFEKFKSLVTGSLAAKLRRVIEEMRRGSVRDFARATSLLEVLKYTC